MRGIYSFECGTLEGFEAVGGQLDISTERHRDGEHSLRWRFQPGGAVRLKAPIGYKRPQPNRENKALPSFVVWLYSAEPLPGCVRFAFGRGDAENCWFDFNLGFTGWRTAWVTFDRDMRGLPVDDMDILTFTAPDAAGTLFLDAMLLCTPIDPRHHTGDFQVPLVNPLADLSANSHWLSLRKFALHERAAFAGAVGSRPLAPDEAVTLETVERRVEAFLPAPKAAWEETECLPRLERALRASVECAYHHAAYPPEHAAILAERTGAVRIEECGDLMLRLAHAYHAAHEPARALYGDRFAALIRHLLDQGWAYGSSLGTAHHLGYPMRAVYPAVYRMREALAARGLLADACAMLGWYSGSGRVFRPEEEMESESLDTMNTLLQGILLHFLMLDDPGRRYSALCALSRWMSLCMRNAPGLEGPFKPDGSAFHHCAHYPAYAIGGMSGAAPVVWALSGTALRIGGEAHAAFKEAVLTMRWYSNFTAWPVGMSARHPVGAGDNAQINTLAPFYYLAKAGVPGGGAAGGEPTPDSELAAAYLRLAAGWPGEEARAQEFLRAGLRPEETPRGHRTMNWACAALHRREEWLAIAHGHSRYLWANEAYDTNNRYGRTNAYGSLQLLHAGEPVDSLHSGYSPLGWDWAAWPGTTAPHLPIPAMRSDVCNVDMFSGYEEMLLSDEAFSGGASLGGDGVFAMKLHGHAKYDASLRARKSWFFLGDKIVCIGTDIEEADARCETRTTLFQCALLEGQPPVLCSEDAPGFGESRTYAQSGALWLVDNTGAGYYVPGGQRVGVCQQHQHSLAQNTGAPTEGDFASAWIDHGTAPQDGVYEYAVLPKAEAGRMERFTCAMQEADAPYAVLCARREAHIVRDGESGAVAYALFEACTLDVRDGGAVRGTDTPCLVFERRTGGALELCVCDPDLRLYEGQEPDQTDENGIQREVSLYSRSWRSNPAGAHTLVLRLRGDWRPAGVCGGVVTEPCGGETVLRVTARGGDLVHIRLTAGQA